MPLKMRLDFWQHLTFTETYFNCWPISILIVQLFNVYVYTLLVCLIYNLLILVKQWRNMWLVN